MSLPPGFLDELRGRVSLARVIGRKVSWEPRKTNAAKGDFWAACPFHQEKSASFHVDDAKGFYYCFGCHAKGDAVTFLRESENLDFMAAVERLAAEAGMAMPARDPAAAARETVRAGLAEAMEAAVRFYRMSLAAAAAGEARAYLERRGVTAETQGRFELGYAGRDRHALFRALTGKGFTPAVLVEAGLCRRPEEGGEPYDLFRDRILFPIRDGRGRAIAFGGRAMAADARAKYLNSPETPLFDKGRNLYNLGPARAAAGKAGGLVVVEGYMDAIALTQAGIGHVVAPLGTAITADQLQLMWRVADEPVVALDGDAAGQGAAQRLVDLALPLLAAGKGLRFALMPPGQDPDDVARAGGAAAVEALLAASRPMVDLLWERETAEAGALDSPERRAALDARLRAHLARIADPSLRAHWQAEIRARRAALFAPAPRPASARAARAPRGPGGKRGAPPPPPVGAGPTTRASLLARPEAAAEAEARMQETLILAGCLAHPAIAARFEHALDRIEFLCADLAGIRDALLAALARAPDDPAAAVAARLGFDPRPRLRATGTLPAARHLADPALAERAVAEALDRHAAAGGRAAETRDAERAVAGTADEGVTWRLREAAEAAHAAVTRPLAEAVSESEDESALSQGLQNMIDGQIWRKRHP
ncbi:DNA primase [Amaricoccus sp.]|uniref:DNA primase n=1 Tax=Amaricoccus sp. TaxID=1872485 RepID=UPI001B59B803|nr:DNA primase [Amaricoccus sp.]MBP7000488.1 DNA primase [Amaricoccus sp.]